LRTQPFCEKLVFVSSTLDPATLAAWNTIVRVQARVAARAEDELAEAGLPPLVWHDVLRVLDEATCGIRMFEVADAITMSRSGLTRLIDRLEEAGLAERRSCPSDRRGSFLAITDAGRETRARMWAVYERVIRDEFGGRVEDAGEIARLLTAAA
jgi:DNA-binding MarR family transcriptional regulator